MDRAREQPSERVDDETFVAIRKMFRLAISSMEGFSTDLAAEIVASFRDDAEYWDWIVDEHYSREAVENIRRIVSRFRN